MEVVQPVPLTDTTKLEKDPRTQINALLTEDSLSPTSCPPQSPDTNYTYTPERPLRSKKTLHILSEQRRREKINDGFSTLRQIVPTTRGKQLSKAAVLKQAVSYIEILEQENQILKVNLQKVHTVTAPQPIAPGLSQHPHMISRNSGLPPVLPGSIPHQAPRFGSDMLAGAPFGQTGLPSLQPAVVYGGPQRFAETW